MQQDEALRQLRAAADFGAARGSLLFHLDLASEIGRSALRDRGIADEHAVALVDAEGYAVVALDGGRIPADPLGTIRFAADGRPVMAGAAGSLSPAIAAMGRARQVLAGEYQPPAYAIIVVPPSDRAPSGAPMEAYALRRSDRPGDVVVGRHWLIHLSPDGESILAREPLSRTELVLQSRPELPPMDLELTHFGATPTELHSYLSLRHGIALKVVSLESGLLWRVDAERVELLGRYEGQGERNG